MLMSSKERKSKYFMTSNAHRKPNNRPSRVRPGFERLHELDQALETGLASDEVIISDGLHKQTRQYALDALATACKYLGTDPDEVLAIVGQID